MPRYFFHLESRSAVRDEIGTELDDFAKAKCHAVQFIAEHLCNRPEVFWERETCEVTVTDDRNLALLVVSMVATTSPAASAASRSPGA